MATAVYPGSFDPVTLGHCDIIERISKMIDHVIIGVLNNNTKTPLFSVDERVEMLKAIVSQFPNVEVKAFDGLLVDFVQQCNAQIIVRGLRFMTDFDYELQMSQTNRVMAPHIDTIFLTTNLKYSYLSSSIVKEIARYQGDIRSFVLPEIAQRVEEKYKLKSK